MDIKRAVGKRIKIVRQRSGLTQDGLAEKVGLSPKYISGIERGVENPTMDNLTIILNVLRDQLQVEIKVQAVSCL